MDGYQPFNADNGNTSGGGSALNFGAEPTFLSGSGDAGDGGANSGDAGDRQFDPTIHIGRDKINADGSYRRKRNRKSNSATSGSRKGAGDKASIDALTMMLGMVHIGLSNITRCPELRLEDKEAETLAASTANVLDEFGIMPDAKTAAVIGLVTTASMIYGPRVYFIRERLKEEKLKKNE